MGWYSTRGPTGVRKGRGRNGGGTDVATRRVLGVHLDPMPEPRPSLVSAPDRSRKPVFRWDCLRLRIAGVPDLQRKPQMQCSQADAASSQSVRKSRWRLPLRWYSCYSWMPSPTRGAFSPDHARQGSMACPCGRAARAVHGRKL